MPHLLFSATLLNRCHYPHFVDEGTDTGPIILQKAVEVKDGDTAETLQKRVMEEAEWIILPKAVEMIANGEVL